MDFPAPAMCTPRIANVCVSVLGVSRWVFFFFFCFGCVFFSSRLSEVGGNSTHTLTTNTLCCRSGIPGPWPVDVGVRTPSGGGRTTPVDRSVLTPQHMHDYGVLCQSDVEKISRTLKFYLEALDAATILHAQPSAQGAAARQRAQQEKQYLVETYRALIERVQTSTIRRYSQVLAASPQRDDTAKKAPRAMLLELWFMEHVDTPYPSSEEKQALARLCSMSARQLATWFTNKRARFKRSAVHRDPVTPHPLPLGPHPACHQPPPAEDEEDSRDEQCRRPKKKRPRPAVSHVCTHFRASAGGTRVTHCPSPPPQLLPLLPPLRLRPQERAGSSAGSIEDWLMEIAQEDSALIRNRTARQRGNQDGSAFPCTAEDPDDSQSAPNGLFSETSQSSGSSQSPSQRSAWCRSATMPPGSGNIRGYCPEP